MKTIYSIIIIILTVKFSNAQITINSTDLMNAGEEFNVSVGDLFQTVDFTTTGPNINWDFSALTFTSQEKDSFFSVSSIGSIYYTLAFDNFLFPANKANIVQEASNFGFLSQLPIPITDIYNFYYKNTSQYRQAGIGATISSVQAPLIFNNKDIIYNFPLNYNDLDSSASDGSLAIPALGYFGLVRNRVNTVDGWGSITTPYGTFNVLRVRSVINETDSIYVDSLGFGLSVPQPEIVEYKWLAQGEGVPVLQINTTNSFGTGEVVSLIRYRDSIRVTAINELNTDNSLSINPNPSYKEATVSFELSANTSVVLNLWSADGKLISEIANAKLAPGHYNYYISPELLKLNAGIYFLSFQTEHKRVFKKAVFVK